MNPNNFFILVFGGLGAIIILSLYMIIFVILVRIPNVKNGMENQGFQTICTEKILVKFLIKNLKLKKK